ncbi:MAG: hypothetical protein J7K98_03485, partial [Candidatus Aenigmarchaeota archaeon]|nr:hypothetical protein [Candidatus Aenigmarchaeota archaeon]
MAFQPGQLLNTLFSSPDFRNLSRDARTPEGDSILGRVDAELQARGFDKAVRYDVLNSLAMILGIQEKRNRETGYYYYPEVEVKDDGTIALFYDDGRQNTATLFTNVNDPYVWTVLQAGGGQDSFDVRELVEGYRIRGWRSRLYRWLGKYGRWAWLPGLAVGAATGVGLIPTIPWLVYGVFGAGSSILTATGVIARNLRGNILDQVKARDPGYRKRKRRAILAGILGALGAVGSVLGWHAYNQLQNVKHATKTVTVYGVDPAKAGGKTVTATTHVSGNVTGSVHGKISNAVAHGSIKIPGIKVTPLPVNHTVSGDGVSYIGGFNYDIGYTQNVVNVALPVNGSFSGNFSTPVNLTGTTQVPIPQIPVKAYNITVPTVDSLYNAARYGIYSSLGAVSPVLPTMAFVADEWSRSDLGYSLKQPPSAGGQQGPSPRPGPSPVVPPQPQPKPRPKPGPVGPSPSPSPKPKPQPSPTPHPQPKPPSPG